VTSLQEIQEEYDKSMALILQELEVLEVKRLTVLKDQNQRFSQSHDFLKSAIEQMAVLLKEGVSTVKIEQDIQDFIKTNVSGKTPTPHVQYQPQASETIGHMVDGKSSSSNSSSLYSTINKTPPMMNTTTTHTTPPPTAPTTNTHVTSTTTSSTVNTPKSSPFKEIKKPGPPPQPNEAQEWYARALYEFESDEPDDLPFPVDAVLKLLQWSDTDDWWQGELNGKRGMFPKNYVEKSLGPPKKTTTTTTTTQWKNLKR